MNEEVDQKTIVLCELTILKYTKISSDAIEVDPIIAALTTFDIMTPLIRSRAVKAIRSSEEICEEAGNLLVYSFSVEPSGQDPDKIQTESSLVVSWHFTERVNSLALPFRSIMSPESG